MQGIIGFIVSIVLVIVMVSWLRLQGPKLITPNLRNAFNIASSTTNGGSGTASSFQGYIVISTVSLGAFRSVSIQNVGIAEVPLSTWKLKIGTTELTIPRGTKQGSTGTAAEPIFLGPQQTAVIYEGVRNDQAIALHPKASWYAWTNNQFLQNKGTITLFDANNKEVATFTY